MTATGAAAQKLVHDYHQERRTVSSLDLDHALGLVAPDDSARPPTPAAAPAPTDPPALAYARTPYPICRAFFHQASPGADDLVVDLGCGDGRVLIYGALTTPARFRGIELDPSRFRAARAAAAALGSPRVSIVRGDVLEQDWSDGTIFYAFRPFLPDVEAVVLARLHALGRRRSIRVGAHRLLPGQFDPAVFERSGSGDLFIYRSHPAVDAPQAR